MKFVLDDLVIEERPRGAEYYGEYVWPAGLAMCDYLKRHPELVKGKRVLELGSGTGVVGLFAAKLGAEHVTLTDFIDWNIENIKKNLKENGLEGRAEPRWFQWGTSLGDRWDVIIGSDVVYPAVDKIALIKAIKTHLKPGGKFILGYNDRPADVMNIFEQSGLKVKELERREIEFASENFSEIVYKNHDSNIYRIIEMVGL